MMFMEEYLLILSVKLHTSIVWANESWSDVETAQDHNIQHEEKLYFTSLHLCLLRALLSRMCNLM